MRMRQHACIDSCPSQKRGAPQNACISGLFCSVLQCVAVCYNVLQCAAVCCSVCWCVAVCCSALQCVAVTQNVCISGLFRHIFHIYVRSFLPFKMLARCIFWSLFDVFSIQISFHVYMQFFFDIFSMRISRSLFTFSCRSSRMSIFKCIPRCFASYFQNPHIQVYRYVFFDNFGSLL